MIIAALAGAALVVSVATGPVLHPDGAPTHPSAQQRNAAVEPLVRFATECIARAVAGDPRFSKNDPTANLGDLIVASVPACVGPVHTMMDAYDRYFGDGTGEAFFAGPYLDVLPAAVNRWITDRAE
jgi:hypothetical protein